MPLYAFGGTTPSTSGNSWVAPAVILTGNVWLAGGASVWFGAVLRCDDGAVIPDNTLVSGQPGSVLRPVPQSQAEDQRHRAFECELKWRHQRDFGAINQKGAA